LDGSATVLVLKLFGTPAVVGAATLAGRRYGPTVTGWLGGLPLASGPLTYFLTVEQGARFGAASATATLAGLVGVAAFVVGFSRMSTAGGWPVPVATGLSAFLVIAAVMLFVPLPAPAAFVAALVALTLGIWLMGSPQARVAPRPAPPWDIPARASLATAMVVGLSAIASTLGARLVGLIAPFPVYASVMASFTHAQDGPAASMRLLRGVLVGCYGFACFYLSVALLATTSVLWAFLVATVAALAVNATSIWVLRRLHW